MNLNEATVLELCSHIQNLLTEEGHPGSFVLFFDEDDHIGMVRNVDDKEMRAMLEFVLESPTPVTHQYLPQ